MKTVKAPADWVRTEDGHRGTRLRWAYGTAVGSKAATVLVQASALPVAVRSLGEAQFAVYAMLAAIFGWLSLANLGMAPVVVVRVTAAVAKGDVGLLRKVTSTAFVATAYGVAVVGLTVATLMVGPIEKLVSLEGVVFSPSLRWGAGALVLMLLIQCQVSVVEAVQAGFMEQHRMNVANTVGSLGCVAALTGAALWMPTVPAMILAVYLPPVLARLINALDFWRRHPMARPKLSNCDLRLGGEFVRQGIAFSMAASLGSFLAHQFPIVLAGRLGSAQDAAGMAVAMNVMVVASGLISTVTTTLWPAIADSVARGDLLWARACYRRVLKLCGAYAGGVALVLILFGPELLAVWVGPSIRIPRIVHVFLGIYIILLTWENVHLGFLVGLKQIVVPSLFYLMRAGAAALGMWLLFSRWGPDAVFAILGLSVVFGTCVPYYGRVRTLLSDNGSS